MPNSYPCNNAATRKTNSMGDFQPPTNEERTTGGFPSKGWHPGQILEAVKKPSKQRVTMIVPTVVVWDEAGNAHKVMDHMGLFGESGTTGRRLSTAKLYSFYTATGRVESFEQGDMNPALFVGKNVEVYTTVKDDPEFGLQLQISKYRAPAGDAASAAVSAEAADTMARAVIATAESAASAPQDPKEKDDIPF